MTAQQEAIAGIADRVRDLILNNADVLDAHAKDAYAEWAEANPDTEKEFSFPFSIACKVIPRGESAEIAVSLKHAVKYSAADAATVTATPAN